MYKKYIFITLLLFCMNSQVIMGQNTEDSWKFINSFEEVIGIWEGTAFIDNMQGNFIYAFFMDNQDFIVEITTDYEPVLDSIVNNLSDIQRQNITKDEIWKSGLPAIIKEYRTWDEIIIKKYYVIVRGIFSENNNNMHNENIKINQYGNKIKISSRGEDVILGKK